MSDRVIETAHRAGAAPEPSPARARIRRSMEALLARAGLDYRGGFTRVGGHAVHYLDYGPVDAPARDVRPPVLLLHGAGAGSAVWYRQIAALAVERRVIAPDHPVLGLSGRPVLTCPMYDFVRDYVSGFLDALGIERVDVAGISLGGFAAMTLAITRPARVRRLAVIDSAGLGRELPWAFRIMSLPWVGKLFTRPTRFLMDRAFETAEVARPDQPDAEFMKRYAFDVTRADGHRAALHSGAVRVGSPGGQVLVLSDERLSRIAAPTLLIWGARDAFFPVRHAERARGIIPGSRLEVLADAGHLSTFDEPERVSSLLADFFGE